MLSQYNYTGFDVLKLNGKTVSVEIIPALGGKIMSFSRNDSGVNHLLVEKKCLDKKLNSGGILQVLSADASLREPGELMFAPFDFKTDEDSKFVRIFLSAKIGDILVEKQIELSKNLPLVKTGIKYTNTGNAPVDTAIFNMVRCPGKYGKAKEKRILVYDSGEKVEYKPLKFLNQRSSLGDNGWAALFNLNGEEALVMTYAKKGKKDFTINPYGLHTTFWIKDKNAPVKPGQSISENYCYWLLKDADDFKNAASKSCFPSNHCRKSFSELGKKITAPGFISELEVMNKAKKLIPADGTGEFSFDFDKCIKKQNKIMVPAGSSGVWEFKFKVKDVPIEKDGSILIRRWPSTPFADHIQTGDPKQDDYASVKTDANAEIELIIEPIEYPSRSWHKHLGIRSAPGIMLKVLKGRLVPGDELVLCIGQKKNGLKTANFNLRSQPGRAEIQDYGLEVYVDNNGGKDFYRIGGKLQCLVVNSAPGRIIAACDSITDENGNFRMVVRVEDIHANLCVDYTGRVCIEPENIEGIPGEIEFRKKDGGFLEFHGRIADCSKPAKLSFSDKENGICGISNTIISEKISGKYNLYWGELHGHTNLSHDGRGDIRYAYHFARDISKLDFSAATDHTIARTDDMTLPEKTLSWWRGTWWNKHREACREYFVPGKFIPLLAQECHPGDGGDHNAFYPDYDTPLIMPHKSVGSVELKQRAYEKLYREIIRKNCVIIPHVGGGGKSWIYHDEQAEPLVEVASTHGRFEAFAQDALSRGYKTGIIYGSDFHCGTPGSSGYITSPGKVGIPRCKSANDCNGFAVVLAEDLSLDSIMDAFRKKRCYAVMGQNRIILEFSINGHIMGREFSTGQPPEIKAKVISSHKIRTIALIRNDKLAHLYKGKSSIEEFTYIDDNLRRGLNYYYIRVTLETDDLAWSSPVWVNFTGKEKPRLKKEKPWDAEEVADLDKVKENEASQYESGVENYLRKITGGRFHGLKGIRVVNNSYGRYALLFGYDGARNNTHTKFMYMLDYEPFCVLASYHWQLFNSLLSPEHAFIGGSSNGK